MIEFFGGYCSGDCTSDDDCGPSGTCVDLIVMNLCFKNCTSSSDCRVSEGYNCQALPEMVDEPGYFCLPPHDSPELPPDGSTDAHTDIPSDPETDESIDGEELDIEDEG
jgi:hypothetical protein